MASNSPAGPHRYRFGRHVFDTSRGLLWRDGRHVPMTPKTADVLRVLLEHRGEVVDKSDLLHFVWPNTVVEENNLARHIRLVASDATRSLLCQRFSPDERWISFLAVDYEQRDVSTIYVMPAAGGPWIQITDGKQYDDKPRWSPDGNAIYFLSARDGAINLWGQWFDKAQGRITGEPFRVTSFRGPQHSLARDLGRVEIAISSNHVFLPMTETSGTIWMLDVANR